MVLSTDRYFKHKFFNENIIKSSMRKGEDGFYHLYIDLVSKEQEHIIGMSTSTTFMLATSLQQDNWKEMLENWCEENQYVDYQPFKMDQNEFYSFLDSVMKEVRENEGYRLGQAIINRLGDKTPTPNPSIFYCEDNEIVTKWFIENYLLTE
tara:strand:+ start:2182 stop:2634 length:453 start_codon:yes stop_codon:yes gene_type:complete